MGMFIVGFSNMWLRLYGYSTTSPLSLSAVKSRTTHVPTMQAAKVPKLYIPSAFG